MTFRAEVDIPIPNVILNGELIIPDGAKDIVVFSHGSGSSRFSPRNQFVAMTIHEQGMATLLFDLLTREEDKEYSNRFDIESLTGRLMNVTQWVMNNPKTGSLQIGYFGASTGAASSLDAAAQFGDKIKAIVSRGGRPDLATHLNKVKAPTLLIVGGEDKEVLELNRKAFSMLQCTKKLDIVPGATHLFEEPGKLKEVALLASKWYLNYF